MRDRWSVERVNLLKAMWASGAPTSAIAAALGDVSRSAVLGKVFRLRLRTGPAAFLPSRARGPGRGKPQDTLRSSPASARDRGKGLLELTNSCCRWIVEAGVKWAMSVLFSQLH
jgi:hypothetical protein